MQESKYKIQAQKLYDDDTKGKWKRWTTRVYENMQTANQAQRRLEDNNPLWGFDLEQSKMFKYIFRIVEHNNINNGR
jgi:hypothetical protein